MKVREDNQVHIDVTLAKILFHALSQTIYIPWHGRPSLLGQKLNSQIRSTDSLLSTGVTRTLTYIPNSKTPPYHNFFSASHSCQTYISPNYIIYISLNNPQSSHYIHGERIPAPPPQNRKLQIHSPWATPVPITCVYCTVFTFA